MDGEQYVVYVDVFFLINFIMDYMILSLTSAVMRNRNKVKRIRIGMAAAFGALYSVIILKPLLNHLFYLTLLSILIAFIMILIAFGYGDIVTYLKSTIFLAIVSFLFGGVINYLYYATEVGVIINETLNGKTNKGVNARKFVIVTLAAYFIMVIVIKFVTNHKRDMNLILNVKLSYKGKSVVTKALYDTGNSLTEPISGKMVHIAEYRILKPMLEGDEAAKENICVIPFQSVGEDNGILYGVRMDEMVVIIDGKPNFLYSPIIAIYHGVLSKTDKYAMILNKDTADSL